MKKRLGLAVATLGVPAMLLAATRTVTFEVKGWTCGSCAASTRIALKRLDGVEDVKTDAEKGSVVVTYDDTTTTPEKMLQTIKRLGYKANVEAGVSCAGGVSAPDKGEVLDRPDSPERVSFFEVPLECGAVDGLGCGSAARPILRKLDGDPVVREAKVNYPGTVLAVVWKDPVQSRTGVPAVQSAFRLRGLETALLRGPARGKALKDFESERWYGSADVDRLSEREAQAIASRLVNRARARLALSPEKLAALTRDLSRGIAATLTRDKGEECAVDPFEGLERVASRDLNPRQMSELRKAADLGAGALPGEAR